MGHVEYKAISDSSLDRLNQKAAELVEDGWEPFGSIAVAGTGDNRHPTYAQAFTRTVREEGQSQAKGFATVIKEVADTLNERQSRGRRLRREVP